MINGPKKIKMFTDNDKKEFALYLNKFGVGSATNKIKEYYKHRFLEHKKRIEVNNE